MAKNVARQKLDSEGPDYQEEYKKLLDKYKQETEAEHRKVVEIGGLHVLGTERHEARRIDNQLRGRCGRQGDPGSSRFYVSLGDDLMRLFGSDRLVGIMSKLGLEEGQVIEHPWVSRSIEIAQRRVEQHNFEIRKQLLEYDNVMNKQREIIYGQRRQILEGISLRERILEIAEGIIDNLAGIYFSENSSNTEPDVSGFITIVKSKFGLEFKPEQITGLSRQDIQKELFSQVAGLYADKEKSIGIDLMRHLERMVFLQIIDAKWKDHLYAMDSLREGIGLRAYGQRDPLVEYKREAFEMFSQMVAGIEEDGVEAIFKLQSAHPERFKGVFSSVQQELLHPEIAKLEGQPEQLAPDGLPAADNTPPVKTVRLSQPKVGRNDPCPCGKVDSITGKSLKYKKCCYPKYG